MDKWQQFIDKVSELRFLKIKERQVNKFNRLLLKNITWFSTVLPIQAGNPQAESAGPQAASTSPLQAGSSQTASTISLGERAVHTQAVSSHEASS